MVIEDIQISKGFRGSTNLKRAGEKIEWSQERQLEYFKCSQDPIYFCENYMKIVHVDRGLVPFEMYDYQKDMIMSMWKNRNTVITTARQIGKALSLDTKIPTPTGWSTMGELDVGDQVIGADGKPTNVIYTSPVFENHDCYEITFDNGSKITADADHLWTVNNTINHNKIETKTTQQLSKDFLSGRQSRYRLPRTHPIEYLERDYVDLDPYTLGIWLGDGHSDGGSFTSAEEDMSHYVERVPYQFDVKRPSCKDHIYTGSIIGLSEDLSYYGLLNNKHIPDDYLYGSVFMRRHVLSGLLDTDGWATKSTANIQLSNNNPTLIAHVRQLINSLGYKVVEKTFSATNSTRLTFNVIGDVNPFLLSRKRNMIARTGRPNGQCYLIRDIRKVETVKTKCIGVDNDDHLFLAGEDMIPTHNSTVTCGFILWYILFHSDKTVALLANKGDTAREIMGKIILAYEHLPKWIQQGVLECNKGSMALENNSRVIATATSGSAIRGYSINLLFIDEAAFIENWEEFFTAVAPTISSGKTTKMILVSTPNGLNHYYKLWTNAIHKRNDYHPIRVTWRQVPGRDEEWRKKTLADLDFDQDKFDQENEATFLGSSGTLIRGQTLKELVHQEPINQIDEVIKQYEAPKKGHIYAIICDVSKGVGLDNSAFSVFDITEMPYKQVATFYDNHTVYADYAEYIHQFAKLYNDAVVLVEINNLGESVARMIWEDFEYDGLLCTENAGSRGKEISTKGPTSKGVDKGLNTTQVTKRKGCSMLKLLVENQKMIINDYDTIHELSRFSKKGSSYEAEPGANDDLVMGLVMFAWLTDQKFFKELTDINTLQSIRNQRKEQVENDLVPFGIILRNGEEVETPGKPDTITFNKKGIAIVSNDMFNEFLRSDKHDFALEQQFNKLFG